MHWIKEVDTYNSLGVLEGCRNRVNRKGGGIRSENEVWRYLRLQFRENLLLQGEFFDCRLDDQIEIAKRNFLIYRKDPIKSIPGIDFRKQMAFDRLSISLRD